MSGGGGGGMAAWKKQNSDPVLVDIKLVDGSTLKGTLLLQREKTLTELFLGTEPFLDFTCSVGGDLVLSKLAVATVRQCKQTPAEQLEQRKKMLQKSESFAVLKLPKTATREQVQEAYVRLASTYHPDRFRNIEMPPEVGEYLEAMTRRIHTAFTELVQLMDGAAAPEKIAAA